MGPAATHHEFSMIPDVGSAFEANWSHPTLNMAMAQGTTAPCLARTNLWPDNGGIG